MAAKFTPDKSLLEALGRVKRHSAPLDVREFDTSGNTTGTMSTIASITADSVLRLSSGRGNPVKWAIPAYESFTTDGTGSQQTFNLSHSLLDAPDTQAAVVWFDGSYEGVPTFDTAADTITVTGPGSAVTVHTYYVSDEPATVELPKSHPSANTSATETLYEANTALVQAKNQNEQPEYLSLNESELQPFIAADMDLSVDIKAPYPVRFTDPDGDGTTATNALLQIPAKKGEDTVEGLNAAIKADMSGR